MNNQKEIDGPVVIGGVGGSGTRIVAELLKRIGFFMGSKTNSANDNLEFANLFFNYNEGTFRNIISNKNLTFQKLSEFEQLIFNSDQLKLSNYIGWGWKNPPSHIYLDFLSQYFKNLKYIFVIRNGLDMAYSKNQNQLINWGSFFNVSMPKSPNLQPKASLEYWRKANQRAINLGNTLLGERFFVIKYEDLCENPQREISRLINFVDMSLENINIDELCSLIIKPETMGRYKQQDLSIFTKKDIESVRQFGFDIDTKDLS